ncbi:hypothetical protein HY345_01320 [Candidatus Microgenomates bacterium]|nr:hypothetical protein [Candidatus Microgenomates bacterium]
MEKKVLLTGFLIILFLVSFLLFKDKNNENIPPVFTSPTLPQTETDTSSDLITRLLKSAVVKVPDTNATIVAKQKVTSFGEMGSETEPYGSIAFLNQAVELSNKTILAVFTYNTGGSGDLFYLASFIPKADAYEMIDSVFLGDRIKFEKLTNTENIVSVSYKDHGPDQAMVEDPAVQIDQRFAYQDGRLVERK